jgi:hypothetical protein
MAAGGMNILPTHRCFDDALDYISERLRRHPGLVETLILVHGIARAPNGTLYAHAWTEEDGVCWEGGLLNGERIWFSVSRDEYYAARQIQETTQYTCREALAENLRSGHYGPWKPIYRMLCGHGNRIMGSIPADASSARILTWD